MRYYETVNGPGAAAAGSVEKIRQAVASTEAKVVARARVQTAAPDLGREVARLWAVLRGLSLAGFVIAAAAGAATARTALASADDTTVNFFWLLASLLGLHILSFLLWLVLMVAAPRRSRGGVLGGAVLWLWRQSAERFGAGAYRTAAAQALATRWASGRGGRWLASGLSHGLWFGYLLGALAMTLALLSAQLYTFVWETTILDAAAYTWLTEALALLPAALGIAVPDQAAVLAAKWPGSAPTGDQVLWSSLLVSVLVLYGLVPRGLALAASVVLAWRGIAAAPLDLSQPYYAQLAAQLSPLAHATRVVDNDEVGAAPPTAVPDLEVLPPRPPAGPIYLLGWEIDEPATGWPPPGTPEQVRDLGRRDGRAELVQAIAALGEATAKPARVVAVVDLRQTPDRGVTAALAALRAAAQGRLVLLLTGATALHRRLAEQDAAARIADWVAAGRNAGIDTADMVAIDLDRRADDSRNRLARLLGPAP